MPSYNIPQAEIDRCQKILDKTFPGLSVKTRADRHIADVRGQRFGMLVALVPTTKKQRGTRTTHWLCECDCGNMHVARLGSMREGTLRSCGCRQRNWNMLRPGVAAFKRLYSRYKKDAERRGLPFKLSRSQFCILTSSDCWYCGKPPSQSIKKSNAPGLKTDYPYNGVDRIDSKKGYVLRNVRPCCGRCNCFKMALSEEAFFAHIKKIYEHLQLGKTEVDHGESVNTYTVVTGRFCGSDWTRPSPFQPSRIYNTPRNPLQ